VKVSVVFLITFLIFSACSWQNCIYEELEILHLESDFGCDYNVKSLLVDNWNQYIVIEDQKAFDTILNLECNPSINFRKYDLVIGQKSFPTWIDTFSYKLEFICPEEKVALTIDIVQTGLTVPGGIWYNAIIPKLKRINDFEVEIVGEW